MLKKAMVTLLALSMLLCQAAFGWRAAPAETVENQTAVQNPQGEDVGEDSTAKGPVLPQKAASLMPADNANPGEDWFEKMNDELGSQLQKVRALAEEKGVRDSKVFAAINDYISYFTAPEFFETVESESTRVYCMLEIWNELEDLKNNFDGYMGLTQALAGGTDYFNMAEDAKQLEGKQGWPQDMFFSAYLPQCFEADYIYYADEYLQGYGMESPIICSISKTATTMEDISAIYEQLSASGMFPLFPGTTMWYGSYLDEEDNYVYVQFMADPEQGGEYMDLGLPGLEIPGQAVMLVSNFNMYLVEFAAMEVAFASMF